MLGLEDEHAHEAQEDALATLVLQKVYVLDYRPVVQLGKRDHDSEGNEV
jgi:hypothetical protein